MTYSSEFKNKNLTNLYYFYLTKVNLLTTHYIKNRLDYVIN